MISETMRRSWEQLAPVLLVVDDERHAGAIGLLEELEAQGADVEGHPLYGLYGLVFDRVHTYEQHRYPLPETSGIDMLAFLMEQHDLQQSDLPELGNQSNVSNILGGKRNLTRKHIQALAERFGVNPGVFFPGQHGSGP